MTELSAQIPIAFLAAACRCQGGAEERGVKVAGRAWVM